MFFVKALKGDEFLKVLNAGEVAALPARDWSFIEPETETKLITLLGSESLLIDMGPNGSADNKIGKVPTTLLNDGNPSVNGQSISSTMTILLIKNPQKKSFFREVLFKKIIGIVILFISSHVVVEEAQLYPQNIMLPHLK